MDEFGKDDLAGILRRLDADVWTSENIDRMFTSLDASQMKGLLDSLALHATPKTKESHPAAWAIYRSLLNDDGVLTRADIKIMCEKMGVREHTDSLCKSMGQNGDISFDEFCNHFEIILVVRQSAYLKEWHRCAGFGVAGNVAGHMAQAGEADKSSAAVVPSLPANIFPFYIPSTDNHYQDRHGGAGAAEPTIRKCHTSAEKVSEVTSSVWDRVTTTDGWQFPVSTVIIDFPRDGSNVQVEPEVALYVDIVYGKDGLSIDHLVPRKVAAFNDCSIRKLDSATKLSEKKNWGSASKGISPQHFKVIRFSPGAFVDRLVLVSYIKRDGEIYKYSVNCPARNYLTFHEPLLDWITERLNHQQNDGKWDNVLPLMLAERPTSAWIALGAGEYTEWGEVNFLQPKDEAVVCLYDEEQYASGPGEEEILEMFNDRELLGMVYLHQTFVLDTKSS